MDSKGIKVPDRWLSCPRRSQLIAERFIVFKTLLDAKYDSLVPEEKRFDWKMLRSSVNNAFHRNLGLVIDLTYTDKFYDKTELENSGCKHVKLSCRGFGEAPTPEITERFVKIVGSFTESNPNDLIGVHCTHGFNRSGFCVIAYLVTALDWDLHAAVSVFSKAREPGIYKEDYLKELVKRYGDDDEECTLAAPALPDWHLEYDDSDKGSRGKPNRGAKVKNGLFMDGIVPDVETIRDPHLLAELQKTVSQMCGWSGKNFPGAQPVSMDMKNLSMLIEARYKVSWKADGQRYMMLIQGQDKIYMFDRDFAAYMVKPGKMLFPQRKDSSKHVFETLLDGEMIIDVYQGVNRPRYLIYDIIKFQNIDVKDIDFARRESCMKAEIVGPRDDLYMKGMLDKTKEPFSVRVKDFWDLVATRKILDGSFSKQLSHEIDGLIFQPVAEPYRMGQCPNILKWKPPNLNSVDFRLSIVREERLGMLPGPVGKLMVGGSAVPFAEMRVTKDLKQYNNKIVECSYDMAKNSWKFLRERTDKSFPNHFNTATAVMNSIRHPVTKELLYNIIENQSYEVRQKVQMARQVSGQQIQHPRPSINGSLSQNSNGSSSSSTPPSRGVKRPMVSRHDPLNLNAELEEMAGNGVGFTFSMDDPLGLKRAEVPEPPMKMQRKY